MLDVRNPGYTQSDGVAATLRNDGTSTCLLRGYPSGVVGIRDDGQQIRLAAYRGVADPARPRDRTIPTVVLRPRVDNAFVGVDSQRACIQDYRHIHTYRSVRLAVANGGSLTIPIVGVAYFACGAVGLTPFTGPFVTPSPAGTDEALRASIQAPTTAAAGRALNYTVTLTNASTKAVPLRSCPSYQQAFYTTGASFVGRYQLNCDTVKAIPAHSEIRYAMQLPVPTKASGPVKFTWTMLAPITIGAVGNIELTTN